MTSKIRTKSVAMATVGAAIIAATVAVTAAYALPSHSIIWTYHTDARMKSAPVGDQFLSCEGETYYGGIRTEYKKEVSRLTCHGH